MSNENLRRESRVEVCVPVVVYRGRSAVSLETADISFKGLFVRTDDPPALRSLVRLRVALFDREFEAHAMAVHVVTNASSANDDETRAPGVGLQFWGLAGPNRAAWDDFVRVLVHAKRGPNRASPPVAPRPTMAEIPTPSGVRVIGLLARVASKK